MEDNFEDLPQHSNFVFLCTRCHFYQKLSKFPIQLQNQNQGVASHDLFSFVSVSCLKHTRDLRP